MTEQGSRVMRLRCLGGFGMLVAFVFFYLAIEEYVSSSTAMKDEERGPLFFQGQSKAEEERASAPTGWEKLEQGQDESPKPTELNLEFTTERLRELNKRFETAPLEEILTWVADTFHRWAQVTSFGPSGMVILDELHRMGLLTTNPTVVTIDTLHLFPETYAHIQAVRVRYSPPMRLKVMRPRGFDSREQFQQQFGPRLWERRTKMYAHITKIEPTTRALEELQLEAWLTGRRRSQGGERAALEVLEITEDGRIKVNPLCHWSHAAVWGYLRAHHVPYNELHDRGYSSVGDVGTTEPTPAGGGERSGRFTHSDIKECGMHSPFPSRWSPGMGVEQQSKFNQLSQQWDEQSTARAAAAGVVQLYRSTFEQAVSRGYPGKHLLVELYAPWCPHCQAFEPDFNQAAIELAAEFPIVTMRMNWPANHLESFDNKTENPYRVYAYPMIYMAHADHRLQPVLYHHDIPLTDWVRTQLQQTNG